MGGRCLDLADLRILDVWEALGGGRIRGRRGQAFWRGGDGYSVALDAVRNCWFDHRDSRGGGVLALVETALSCDRRAALRWLIEHCGLLKRGEQHQAPAGEDSGLSALADQLSDFERGLRFTCERRLRLAAKDEIDPAKVSDWHRFSHRLSSATPDAIGRLWISMNPEIRYLLVQVGRAERKYAESITAEIVAMLAKSQESVDR